MRTTIDLDAVVLKELKALRRTEGKTLGQLASELLASALVARHKSRRTRRPKLKSFNLGVPLVDLNDRAAVQAILDAEDARR
jgi:hypothetical protein